jgi:hypothetical protein
MHGCNSRSEILPLGTFAPDCRLAIGRNFYASRVPSVAIFLFARLNGTFRAAKLYCSLATTQRRSTASGPWREEPQ